MFKVINLFGGPGISKSTTASGLFFLMKVKGYKVELITEVAKDFTWEKRFNALSDQIYVFAKQNRRQYRLLDHKIDWVITDSPLLLGLAYIQSNQTSYRNLEGLVLDTFDSYENRNVLLNRTKEYVETGRNQTKEEAIEKDKIIKRILDSHNYNYLNIDGNETAPHVIFKELVLNEGVKK